ncbi:hypothetical protein STIAU_4839 [Stigmatella aurantiaca DW4/3-1]|uniref:Uncharacterized protein n=1 Tax=Stigmatella aurantiaca (strain DW4/3-1) TaxID=378806 RepID=Q08ZU7_STIAD|nr:hypothetical protein STIAU_4839 [Stigmatella aurantiaca DW4/3-1]
MGPRILDEVLDVVTDLPDVVTHGQLDMAVALHRAPQQVLALGGPVDAPGGLHRGERIHVPEDDGHGDFDLREAALEVVIGAVADHLPAANPAGELLQHLARLPLPPLAQQPADVVGADPGGVAQPVDARGEALVERMPLGAGQLLLRVLQPGIHRYVPEARFVGLHPGREALAQFPVHPPCPARQGGPAQVAQPALRVDALQGHVHQPADGRGGQRQGLQQEEAPPQIRGGANGDEPLEIIVDAGIAVAEHPAHGVPAVEDPVPPGDALHPGDGRGQVVEEVAVDVPAVVEIRGQRPAEALGPLALEGDGALAVASQFQDVNVRAEEEQVLDELAARPSVPVLREAVHHQQRLAKERLRERLLHGPVPRHHQRPTVRCLNDVVRLLIQRPEVDLVDGGYSRPRGLDSPVIRETHVSNLCSLVFYAKVSHESRANGADEKQRARAKNDIARARLGPGARQGIVQGSVGIHSRTEGLSLWQIPLGRQGARGVQRGEVDGGTPGKEALHHRPPVLVGHHPEHRVQSPAGVQGLQGGQQDLHPRGVVGTIQQHGRLAA